MKLTHENYGQLTVLTLRGDLTLEFTDEFRRCAAEHLAKETRYFVLDLSVTEFVDSRGLEALLWLQDQCGERLGQVRLAGAGPNLEKILCLTRLTPRFDRHPDVDSAIKSLRI